MAYKLTIADVIELSIKFTLNDAGKTAVHSFALLAQRMTQDELRATLKDGDLPTRDLLHQRVIGWRGQRLVVDEGNNAPADFNAESFDCLLSLVGMESIVLSAYLKAVVLADSQAEKAKN